MGVRNLEFLELILKHARRLRRYRRLQRSSLYLEVVGGLLESANSAVAPLFSQRLRVGSSITSQELLDLFPKACKSGDLSALKHFRLICDSVPNHKIYHHVVPFLCEQDRLTEAMTIHTHLIRRQDYPTKFTQIEPLIRHIAQDDLDLAAFIRNLKAAGLSFATRVQTLYDSIKETRFGISLELMDRARNKTFGVTQQKISDAFAARVFATKSFSFDFALTGLHVLGTDEIGPLSLRQIALQANDASIIRQRLAKMDDMGIDTGGSAYSRVVRRLASKQEDSLLMNVVHCDQHPDVFEDPQIQLELLNGYAKVKDWAQVNRTLAILDVWRDSGQRGSNVMLRIALTRRDWPEVTKIIAQIHQHDGFISRATIFLMYQYILRRRNPRSLLAVDRKGFQDLMYLITLWQNTVKSGIHIPADAWREPLRRLGMMGKWRDLERICFWLCSYYSSQGTGPRTRRVRSDHRFLAKQRSSWRYRHLSIITKIFSARLQRALVEWGFIAGLKVREMTYEADGVVWETESPIQSPIHEATWIRGIELLCRLRSICGLQLDDVAIKTGCEERLRQLFSRHTRSTVLRNREAKRMNKADYFSYVDRINKVYGKTLFDLEKPQYLVNIFLPRRKKVRSRASVRVKGTNLHKSKRGGTRVDGDSVDVNDIVGYRDLFTASWEEYEPRKQKNKN